MSAPQRRAECGACQCVGGAAVIEELAQREEAVEHSAEAHVAGGHTQVREPGGIGVALVAQRVELGGDHQRRGSGGIPVARDGGVLRGVEAVVDKDLTSSLLAVELDADELMILTDVETVVDGWRTASARPLRETTVTELRAREWDPGSMGPKVEAACRFVEQTGRVARIGSLEHAGQVLAGVSGTKVSAV